MNKITHDMRVAIASLGNSLDAGVSPVFARAPFLIFVDVENGEVKGSEAVPNPGVQAMRGAGIVTSQLVVDKGANAVVAGNFGPNAYTLLAQSGIKVYSASGISVKEAAIKAEKGELAAGIASGFGVGFGRGRGWGRGRGRGRWMW